MAKATVKKCECGRVSNPIQLMIVTDAWLNKKNIAHFEFNCPQCKKRNVVKSIWNERPLGNPIVTERVTHKSLVY